MSRRYGVNVASVFTWGLLYGPEDVVRLVKEAGYDGIQYLPLRWVVLASPLRWLIRVLGLKSQFKNSGLWPNWEGAWVQSVISYEGPWNTGTLWQAIQRFLGIKGDSVGSFIDWLLFGDNPDLVSFNGTFEVVHDFNKNAAGEIVPFKNSRTIIEIHPGHPMNDYLKAIRMGIGLCLDTNHLRRPPRGQQKPIWDWEEFLKKIPANAIKLVHFQAKDPQELEDFLSGQKNELYKLLRKLALKMYQEVPVIVEVKPSLVPNRKADVERLTRIHSMVSWILG